MTYEDTHRRELRNAAAFLREYHLVDATTWGKAYPYRRMATRADAKGPASEHAQQA